MLPIRMEVSTRRVHIGGADSSQLPVASSQSAISNIRHGTSKDEGWKLTFQGGLIIFRRAASCRGGVHPDGDAGGR